MDLVLSIVRIFCESTTIGGTFYPAIVVSDGPININADTTINYMLVVYNFEINVNAKVTFIDNGKILGTIGDNGKIVIGENGKIAMPASSFKPYGNTSDYSVMLGTGSRVTIKTLMANGLVLPASGDDNTDVPILMRNIGTTSYLIELDGNFKLNKPLMIAGNTGSSGSNYILKEDSTLDMLSDLTIDNGSKLSTEVNSKLLNSGNLVVNGSLNIHGSFHNGYKLDSNNNPTTTTTGGVTIGDNGKITLFANATGTNNSTNDIPVTLSSGNPGDASVESVIPGNGLRTITISSEITNGTVTSSKSSATSGEEIILTITPATGYKLKSITVLDKFGEQPVTVTDNKFTMPSYNVFVNATFEQIVDNPQTRDNILCSILLGSISLICLIGVSIYLKKKRIN